MKISRGAPALAGSLVLLAMTLGASPDPSGFRIAVVALSPTDKVEPHTLSQSEDPVGGILRSGRIVMRHSDGTLSAVIAQHDGGSNTLSYASSSDGRAWSVRPVPSTGGASQPALDANDVGTYVAYVSGSKGAATGRLFWIPRGGQAVQRSGDLTTAGGNQYTFVSASRNGFKSVAYGWFDPARGSINVGVSADGKSFPTARPIVVDRDALYGPSIGILGRYVIVSYLTRNSAIAPNRVQPNAAYVGYVESSDGGKTWSHPDALFGRSPNNFPSVHGVKLTGAVPISPDFLQALAWYDFTMANSRVFVSSTLQAGRSNVGMVSFKMPQRGGSWTNVVVQDPARRQPDTTWMHQYAALPDTPVRALVYVDENAQDSGQELVVSMSTDTGKHFDKFVRYSASQLGLASGTRLLVRSSACLWRDSAGAVALDALVLSPGEDVNAPSKLVHVTLPLGLNVKGGQVSTTSVW